MKFIKVRESPVTSTNRRRWTGFYSRHFSISQLRGSGTHLLAVAASLRRPQRTAATTVYSPEGERFGWPTCALGAGSNLDL